MITVDVYLLNGHAPSANIGRLVDLYLETCPGIILRKTTVQSRAQLMEAMGKRKLPTIPCIEVPGEIVHGKRKREFLTSEEDIEKWCRSTVQTIDRANRGRRRR